MPTSTDALALNTLYSVMVDEALRGLLSEKESEFIRVLDLHITDAIIEGTPRGKKPHVIAELHRNPRGCPGKTHVKLQNGPTQCYDNICTVEVKRIHG